MSIREDEESLFQEWSRRSESIVRDGVVDESSYLNSDPRTLLVLKEVNDEGGGGWDLRDFVRNGAKGLTWNNVTRWMRGIQNLDRELPWTDVEPVSQSDRERLLRSLCIMNLKKSPGSGSADREEVRSAARANVDLLRRQFELYDPDLIICGGVSGLFRHVIDAPEIDDWDSTERGVSFFRKSENQYVIDYFHPQARYKASMLYYHLIDAVRDLRGHT